jgi:hypothetical protein
MHHPDSSSDFSFHQMRARHRKFARLVGYKRSPLKMIEKDIRPKCSHRHTNPSSRISSREPETHNWGVALSILAPEALVTGPAHLAIRFATMLIATSDGPFFLFVRTKSAWTFIYRPIDESPTANLVSEIGVGAATERGVPKPFTIPFPVRAAR